VFLSPLVLFRWRKSPPHPSQLVEPVTTCGKTWVILQRWIICLGEEVPSGNLGSIIPVLFLCLREPCHSAESTARRFCQLGINASSTCPFSRRRCSIRSYVDAFWLLVCTDMMCDKKITFW